MIVSRNKIFKYLALLCVIALAIISGWRDVGIDRENYLLMYYGVISNDDITVKLYYAKDLAFLLLSSIASFFSSNPKLAFLFICLLSVVAKYFAVKRIASRYILGFLVAYAFFLSPGLEFAAIRGGLAIGFVMLALAYSEKLLPFILFSLLAVISHMTMLPVVFFVCRPVNELLARHKISYIGIAIFVFMIAASLISFYPHGAGYAENQGTALAYALPIATLIISELVFYRFSKVSIIWENASLLKFLANLKGVIYGLIAIAFGISGVVVTAGTRYLEVAWVLLLLPALILHKSFYPNFLGLVFLIVLLSYLNIYRLTWLSIISPVLG